MEGQKVSHYTILNRLGRGGMGIVYRAEDRKLGRTVALKFLTAEMDEVTADARERFFREARAASALDHPRICTVFEIGESDDGRPFIAMAYCAGETLRERIQRGTIPFDEALTIVVQIAEGLAAAHEAGVVHRDIKPANIMLTPGGVKILDFGLAKLADVTQMTQTGATLGTPAYMAPEQAKGEKVDPRCDIWSLGAIVYEMVTGQRAFAGDNPTAIMFAILSHDVPPLTDLRSDVPDEFQRVVRKCLEREPDERYQNLRELLVDLGLEQQTLILSASGFDEARTAVSDTRGSPAAPTRRVRVGRRAAVVAVALAVVLAVVLGWKFLKNSPPSQAAGGDMEQSQPVTQQPLHVVAVADFVNRTGDPELDWYGEAIARLVTDALTGSRLLHVVSDDNAEAGDRFDVLVTGEILPGASGVTVAARIVESRTGRSLAAKRLDGLSTESLLACADAVAAEARRGLGLPPEDSVDVFSADFVVDNPEAYRSYLEGLRAFVDWRYDEAERGFSEALGLMPDFTMARYRLAWVYIATGRREEALSEIRRAADDSERLTDRESRYVRAALADFESRLDDAVFEYEALVEAYPYDADARHMLAGVLHDSGRFAEEIEQLEVLAGLNPDDSVVRSMLGYAHLATGNFTGAVVELQRYVALEPESANGHHSLGDTYRAQGEFDLATAEYNKALAADESFHLATTSLAVVEVLQGQLRAAESLLMDLVRNGSAPPKDRVDAVFDLASVLRCQGRFREAAEALDSMAREIEEEQVREAMALSIQGTSLAEIGDLRAARRQIDRAIDRSPGVPTRYLFARGVVELRQGDVAAARRTANEIVEFALPPDDPDRTEDKAAAYLEGMAMLADGAPEEAIDRLSLAVASQGYEYAIYRLGLAEAYLAAGRYPEAMAAARQTSESFDPSAPRLDLELDRIRAVLLLAKINAAMDRPDKASARAGEFLSQWRKADPGLPDVAAAKKLTGGLG